VAEGGSVITRIEPEAKCHIEAIASCGRVDSEIPLAIDAGALGKTKLTARLGGGGP
jgi:hypothetical protein